jgi:beta-1,4-mannosyltransferase
MKILAFPKDSNPYQEFLYKELRSKYNLTVEYYENEFFDKHAFILGIPAMPFRLLNYRLKGFNVFHLHWFYGFLIPIKKPLNYYLSSLYIYAFILFLKLLRFKIIWTVHNIEPHSREFLNDKSIYKFVASFSDKLICHSESTINDLQDIGINTNKVEVIPIGNYISIYENVINRNEARMKLNLNNEDTVLCFFGRVMKYKGIEELLPIFKNLNNKNIKLIIAGKCDDQELKNTIESYKNLNNLILDLRFISDNEIQMFMNASDLIILPFKKITTSSTVIMAFGFSKSVIAPRIGAIKDFPDEIGFFYNNKDVNGLENAINKSINDKSLIIEKGHAAFKYAQNLSWDKIAEQTYNLYKSL